MLQLFNFDAIDNIQYVNRWAQLYSNKTLKKLLIYVFLAALGSLLQCAGSLVAEHGL